jgi:hypothetical protein
LERGQVWRVAWIFAGVIVLVAVIVMILLPGPALAVVPFALALIALGFAWGQRLLDEAVVRGERVRERTANAPRRRKLLGALAALLVLAASVAVGLLVYF